MPLALLLIASLALSTVALGDELTFTASVDEAVEKGVAWLLNTQQADGSWLGPDYRLYYGMTAFATYTLLKCGFPTDHPAVRAGAVYTAHRPCTRTYDAACVLMALQALGSERPKKLAKPITLFLIDNMGNGSRGKNLWGYPFGLHGEGPATNLDLSNTQYALLGLRAAAGIGVHVPGPVWEETALTLLDLQRPDGSFIYKPGRNVTASMTVAGMASLLMCKQALARYRGKARICRRIEDAVKTGLLLCTSAQPYLMNAGTFARPQDIEVRINQGRPLKITLHDSVRRKQTLVFKKTKVRSLQIAIKSVYLGTTYPRNGGFREIELYCDLNPEVDPMQPFDREKSSLLRGKGEDRVSWKYVEKTPSPSWMNPDFADGAWNRAEAPFGANLKGRELSPWTGTDIWLRRSFFLTAIPDSPLLLQVASDDRAEIYLNGVLAGKIEVYTKGQYRKFAVDEEASKTLKTGKNTIAVHAKNIGGASLIDVFLLNVHAP